MSKFKVGDMVEIVAAKTNMGSKMVGECGLVIQVLVWEGTSYYLLDIDERCYWPSYGWTDNSLRLKRPPEKREDLELGDWDLCPWRPTKERV
jgi:hypothetical protein